MQIEFELLNSTHARKSFDCGNPTLNAFLQRQARQNADRNVGVTHVVVANSGDASILAYYTLVTRTVDCDIVPPSEGKLPYGPLGVALLGRLAVDKSAQGRGLGKTCLSRAMLQVERAAREMGIYALVLDAVDERARDWYVGLDLGFKTFLDDPNHLFISVQTIRQALTDSRAL